MKNKNFNKILLGVLLIILSVSCQDPLDKQPLDLISDAAVWQDEALINSYLAHLYSSAELYQGGTAASKPDKLTMIISQGGAGRGRGNQEGIMYADGRVNENDEGPLGYWKYDLIRKINVAIEKLEDEGNTLPPEIKSIRLGEVYFLRAFVFFRMVMRYGGLPIIDNVQDISLSNEELQVARSTEADSYDFIAADCDKAIALFENSNPEYGRATKWATLALKSRAMLYAGSIGEFGTVQKGGLVGIANPDKYWQLSMQASREIINNGPFSLYDNYPNGGTIEQKTDSYKKIFTEDGNSEVILAEDFTGESGKGTSWEHFYAPVTDSHGGWGSFCKVYFETLGWFDKVDGSSGVMDPSKIGKGKFNTLEFLIGNRDPRFYATIATQGSMYDGEPVYCHTGSYVGGKLTTSGVFNGIPAVGDNRNSMRSAAMAVKGMRGGIAADGALFGDHDWVVFRLGEIYLNYAEAAFALGDPNGDALQHLNDIRNRAGMPDRNELTWDVIKSERNVELIFEHHRFWDLRRWRDAVSVLSDAANGGTSTFSAIDWKLKVETGEYEVTKLNSKNFPEPNVNYRNFLEKHYYLPITLARVQDNNVLIENPGYGDN